MRRTKQNGMGLLYDMVHVSGELVMVGTCKLMANLLGLKIRLFGSIQIIVNGV